MNWEKAMRQARFLATLFGIRYRVYGYDVELCSWKGHERTLWFYGVQRIEGEEKTEADVFYPLA